MPVHIFKETINGQTGSINFRLNIARNGNSRRITYLCLAMILLFFRLCRLMIFFRIWKTVEKPAMSNKRELTARKATNNKLHDYTGCCHAPLSSQLTKPTLTLLQMTYLR